MKKKKKSLTRWIVTILLLAILAAAIWLIVLPMFRAQFTTTYDTYTASVGTISNSLSFSGNFALVNSQTFAAPAAGTVRAVYVKAGDDVKNGDKLVRLSTGETLKAEFDGRVNAVGIEAGDEVAQGEDLIQVADFKHQQVSIRVDEYDINDVAVGQACTVTATAQEKSFESSISKISYVSTSTGNVAYYTAVCELDVDEGVYPGMQATVTIPKEEVKDVVILKMDALSFARDNSAFVYKMNEAGEMVQTPVTLGVNNENYTEITSGLSDGDTVYVEAEAEEAQSLFAGLFGSTRVNQPAGMNRGNYNRSGSTGSGGNFGGNAGAGAPPPGFGG